LLQSAAVCTAANGLFKKRKPRRQHLPAKFA
jgi:hypothetical protein